MPQTQECYASRHLPGEVATVMYKCMARLVSWRPTLKKEDCVQKFSVRSFDWMTFTGYVSVMPTSIQPDPLDVKKV